MANKYLEKLAWEIVHVKPEHEEKANKYWHKITTEHTKAEHAEYVNVLKRKQRNTKIRNTLGYGLGGAALGLSTYSPVAAVAGTILGASLGYHLGKKNVFGPLDSASKEFHLIDNKKYVEHIRKKGWNVD